MLLSAVFASTEHAGPLFWEFGIQLKPGNCLS